MELVPYTDDDMWLTEALETDPRVMAELGGPWPREKIPEIHRRRVAAIAEGAWYMKIEPEPGGQPVGAVTIWHSDFQGRPISEAGWTVLPQHQGHGYASEALRLLLARADADGRWADIHAFPGVTNAPSNALCRKFGFELLGEVESSTAAVRCAATTGSAGGHENAPLEVLPSSDAPLVSSTPPATSIAFLP